MKFQVILYADGSEFQYENVLACPDGSMTSAFARSLEWAKNLIANSDFIANSDANSANSSDAGIAVLGTEFAIKLFEKNKICDKISQILSQIPIKTQILSQNSVSCLLENMTSAANSSAADFVVFADAASAFLDLPLAKRLIQNHVEYKAEYTFADGYPAGFAPEILDCGALKIIEELSRTVSAEAGKKSVSGALYGAASDSPIFEVIKGDVNSFEIETEISSFDYRLLRLNFVCSDKLRLEAAKNLCALLKEKNPALLEADTEKTGEDNVLAVSDLARESVGVLKTFPAYYQIQICDSAALADSGDSGESAFMPYERFETLADSLKAVSGNAVVSLSLFGEAALHPDLNRFIKKLLSLNLTPLIEIGGEHLSAALERLSALDDAASSRLIVIALLDAFTEQTFAHFHKGLSLSEAVASLEKLAGLFPETYAQFTRVKKNEAELEGFYRFWSDKNSPTRGKLIIQKYDDFCGALPDEKTADLSPVVREPCWHLRRDMEILIDGSVPVCRETLMQQSPEIVGNVFAEKIGDVWSRKDARLASHIKKDYPGICGKCDEYYTFNF